MPIFQRQRNVLNLTYWHAVILTHRQAVLDSFAQFSQRQQQQHQQQQQQQGEAPEGARDQESVRLCLAAAMDTMNTIDEITQSRQMFHAFWVGALLPALWSRVETLLTPS